MITLFKIDFSSNELEKNLKKGLLNGIKSGVEIALSEIRDEAIEKITDNQYWNKDAVYKTGPQEGEKYDLEETGQVMSVLREREPVQPDKGRLGFSVGVGNIEKLDSLVSPRKGSNPDNRYWRLVVYGRAAIPGWKFVKTGVKNGKIRGYAVQKDRHSIAPSEPTMMIENGLKEASKSFSKIVSSAIKKGIGGKKR